MFHWTSLGINIESHQNESVAQLLLLCGLQQEKLRYRKQNKFHSEVVSPFFRFVNVQFHSHRHSFLKMSCYISIIRH